MKSHTLSVGLEKDRFSMKQIDVKIKKPASLLTKYIQAMVAYDTLKSDENYKYLEAAKKEYKDFLALGK